MRSSIPQAVAVLLAIRTSSAQDEPENPCKSFGIDFQDEGSYFQNISSHDPFTFVSTFEGCQDDLANNIIVDPNGDQYMCSDTPLQPNDAYQMSTCPLTKNSLWSGDWSVIIISNNGDADPIAYMRDFVLSVGEPVTSTVTPTISIGATTTPIVNSTSTHVVTDTTTSTKIVTSPYTKSKTVTITPKRTVTTKTKILGTVTKKAYKVEPTVITITKTKTCSVPHRQPHRDPWCTLTPTIAYAAALETAPTSSPTSTPTSTYRRRRDSSAAARSAIDDRAAFLAARSARLASSPHAIEKRGLDNSTVTITEPNTTKWQTSTAWTTAAPSTMVVTVERVTTVTAVSTKTNYKGVTKVVSTVTAPTPTKTKTKYTVVRTTSTITRRPTFRVTTKIAPASSTAICKAKGGKLV